MAGVNLTLYNRLSEQKMFHKVKENYVKLLWKFQVTRIYENYKHNKSLIKVIGFMM